MTIETFFDEQTKGILYQINETEMNGEKWYSLYDCLSEKVIASDTDIVAIRGIAKTLTDTFNSITDTDIEKFLAEQEKIANDL